MQEVFKRLDAVSTSLAHGGQKLSEYAIKWTMFYNVGELIISIIVLLVSPFVFRMIWVWNSKREKEDYADMASALLTVGAVAFAGFYVFALAYLPTILANIACPQWAVVNSIISGLKSR